MKYQVTHRCGHTAVHRLYGSVDARERQLERLAGEDCWECEKARRAEAAAKAAETQGLPTLTGSDKQVAWALQIRNQKLADLERWVKERLSDYERYGEPERAARFKEQVGVLVGRLEAQTDAKFWIDSRYDGAQELLRRVTRG